MIVAKKNSFLFMLLGSFVSVDLLLSLLRLIQGSFRC